MLRAMERAGAYCVHPPHKRWRNWTRVAGATADRGTRSGRHWQWWNDSFRA